MGIVYNTNVTAVTSVDITHNLNRSDIGIRLLNSTGNVVNNNISYFIKNPSDPKNRLNIYFTSSFTGRVQILSEDIVKVPVSENASGISPGGNNFSSTSNPTSANNLSSGYKDGSFWYNTLTTDLFLCTVSNFSTATWVWNYNFSKYIFLRKNVTQTISAALSDIVWSSSEQNISNYYSSSGNKITINSSGNYRITYNVTSSNSLNNNSIVHRFVIIRTRSSSDTEILDLEVYIALMRANTPSTSFCSGTISLLQNDQIRLQGQRFLGGGVSTIHDFGNTLQIERVG